MGRASLDNPWWPVARASMVKHHLSHGTRAGPGSAVAVADDLVGLHSTAPEAPYLSLHARAEGPVVEELDDALYRLRTLVRLKAMRGTVFVMPVPLAAIAFAATRETTLDRDRRWLHVDRRSYTRLAPAVLDILTGGAKTVAELGRSLRGENELAAVVALLCDEGRVVRDRPRGSRRSTTFAYRRWEEAFPGVDLAAHEVAEATRLLVGRYVDRFGPVSWEDILWWTGLPAAVVRPALKGLGDMVRPVALRGIPDGLFTCDPAALRHVPREPPVVRLLPRLDPFTMGYHDRSRFLDTDQLELVYDRGGNATSVVLVDGRVVGVWDLTEVPRPTARVLLFDPASVYRTPALEQAAAAGELWFGRQVAVQEFADMVPLSQRTGVMRKPLDGARLRDV